MEAILEQTQVCYNVAQMAKAVAALAASLSSGPLSLTVKLLKKVRKDKMYAYLTLNDTKFTLIFDSIYTKPALIKQTRREFPSALFDELSLLPNLIQVVLLTDSTVTLSDSAVKRFFNPNLTLFVAPNLRFAYNKVTLEAIRSLTGLVEFSAGLCLKTLSMLPLFELLNKVMSSAIKQVNIKFYTESLNYDSFSRDMFEKLCRPKNGVIPLIEHLKVDIILTAMPKTLQPNITAIPPLLARTYLPKLLTVTYCDLAKSEDKSRFCVVDYKYSKRTYFILSGLKRVFSNKLFYENKALFDRLIEFSCAEIFNENKKELLLSIPEGIKTEKFILNLRNDYFSVVKRGIQYTQIYQLMREYTEKLTIIKTEKFDLNSFSKIIKKISNNQVIEHKSSLLSIGGSIQPKSQPHPHPLNCLIEANQDFSQIRIATFKVETMLPLYLSAGQAVGDNFYLVGGMTEANLMPNMVNTPVYEINLKELIVKKFVVLDQNGAPGAIFSHNVVAADSCLVVGDGFVLEGYKGGLGKQDKPKVAKNSKSFTFSLKEGKWLKNDSFDIKI